jgi:hypothetical protein
VGKETDAFNAVVSPLQILCSAAWIALSFAFRRRADLPDLFFLFRSLSWLSGSFKGSGSETMSPCMYGKALVLLLCLQRSFNRNTISNHTCKYDYICSQVPSFVTTVRLLPPEPLGDPNPRPPLNCLHTPHVHRLLVMSTTYF